MRKYDEIIDRCVTDDGLASRTLVEVMSESSLREELAKISFGEFIAALVAMQKDKSPTVRDAPLKRRAPRAPRTKKAVAREPLAIALGPDQSADQLNLLPKPSPLQEKREELDRRILAMLQQEPDDGLLSTQILAALECSKSTFRAAMKRLSGRGLVIRTGRTTNTRYHYHRSR